MNILPKKRWHVRTKDNIARVRRDEAEALEKEKEITHRAKLAEQEARVDILRQKARKNEASDVNLVNSCKADDDIFTSSGNINFFKELEAGLQGGSSTKKEEDRKEKEAYEKKIGLLTQLGQDSMELSGGKYWYEEKSYFSRSKIQDADSKEVGLKQKMAVDPLNEILKHTGSSIDKPIMKNKVSLPECTIPATATIIKHKKKKSKRKKHKYCTEHLKKKLKHKKKKSKKYHSSDSEEELLKINKMRKLRQERLEREAVEKIRAERLLNGKDPDGKDIPVKETTHQKYSSQFNPNFARQNKSSL